MLLPQLEEFRGEDGGGEEAQEKEATDGQIFHILPTMRFEHINSASVCRGSCGKRAFSAWTDLVLWLSEPRLDPFVKLFEGHSQDGRTLGDRADYGLGDAGQILLQHFHAAVAHLLLRHRALE